MKIHIKNQGAISEARIETKPFTIIIGKNNQGKSYLVELIFCLLQLRRIILFPGFSFEMTKDGKLVLGLALRDVSGIPCVPFMMKNKLLRQLHSAVILTELDLQSSDEEFIGKIINQTFSSFASLLEGFLPFLLEERFGMKLEQLVNINDPSATVTVDLAS